MKGNRGTFTPSAHEDETNLAEVFHTGLISRLHHCEYYCTSMVIQMRDMIFEITLPHDSRISRGHPHKGAKKVAKKMHKAKH